MTNNIILDTDSYKSSHFLQYPPGATSMFSYIESRGGKFPSTVFFGLQYYLKAFLAQRITMEMVDEAKEIFEAHGEPFPYEGWKRIATKLNGRIPVRIRAVPEGMLVPVRVPLVTIESTDPETFWVVNWLETMLVRIWHPINVATVSFYTKELIKRYMYKTAGHLDGLEFKLHDFGARGVSSLESGGLGGLAHLVNFRGSDTMSAIVFGRRYYNTPMAGFSIPAAEHSTVTSWGRDGERDAYRNMLKQFAKPGALLAVVSDSYDIFNATENIWGGELKQEVIDSGAMLVVRPDSGDPSEVVERVLRLLDKKFGSSLNAAGYKLLNHTRVIQGDGISIATIEEILERAQQAGFSAENINFGEGSGLLQKHDRDTQKMAMKCCSITVNGEIRDVFKQPVTDPGKRSKRGRLDTVRNEEGELWAAQMNNGELSLPGSVMRTVFENGELLIDDDLATIRNRTAT